MLKTVLMLSLSGSLLALALLAARRFLGKKLPSTFFYYAWLVVLLRLILPLPGMLPMSVQREPLPPVAVDTPMSDWETDSVLNAENLSSQDFGEVPESSGNSARTIRRTMPFDILATQGQKAPAQERSVPWNWEQILLWVWILGAVASLASYGICYGKFVRAVRRQAIPASDEDMAVFSRFGGRKPGLIRSPSVKTPMLIGTLGPLVVIPDRDYSEETLGNIFCHELTHYRRRDIWYKWFAVTVYSVHWFNPLMLAIRGALDRDCELSCDELLLRRMNAAEKNSYGQTLLALAADRAVPGRLVATTFATEKRNLKERLEQIMTYRKMGKAALALLLCTLLLLCGCAATMGPAKSQTGDTPDAIAPTMEEATEPIHTEPNPDEQNGIRVTNVDELLDAIGPDREIVLAPGEYNLTKSAGYSRMGGEWYHWESCSDGYELVITGVSNMVLRGENGVTICTEPRYANVLKFVSVSDVTLENLTVGHTIEEGYCTGGVLYYEKCTDLEVRSCRLYGCGTWGVELYNCCNFHMDGTDIYECSYGCAYIEGCYNVLFENGKFHDCRIYYGAFQIFGSQEVAVINSEIFNIVTDYGYGSLLVSSSPGVYLGGLDVHDNGLSAILDCLVPPTVESCRLIGGSWDGAVGADGNLLTQKELNEMTMRYVHWEPKVIETVSAPAVSEDGKIHVTNVDEFLAAIGSDTVIYLEPGEYNLSQAQNYGSLGGSNYGWRNTFDGSELVISGVSNLTIEGAGTDQSVILTSPRYANVIAFEYVTDLTLLNFTAGHTEFPGECSGGVIGLTWAENTRIEGCSLFGCGVMGVWAYDCRGLQIRDTEIFDCSDGATRFFGCTEVSMDGCYVHDNGSPTYYADSDSQVQIDGMPLTSTFLMTDDSAIDVKEPENVGNTEVHVASVDDFLAAIAPNTTIFLEPGVYDLTQASDYGASGGSFYRWEETYDGYELVIFGVNGLTIDGVGKDQVQILATPRYANVLRFEYMNDLILKNVTAGHSEAPGECSGGVIYLEGIGGAKIENCGLFGCGVVGIAGADSNGLYVYGTEIYDCSYTSAEFYSCHLVRVIGCDIHDNGCDEIYFQDCVDVAYDS